MALRSALLTFGLAFFGLVALGGAQRNASEIRPSLKGPEREDKLVLSETEWRKRLTPRAYNILRQEGTEAPFSSSLLKVHTPGTFVCAGCGLPLYRTADKFDSGTGWPSFVRPIVKDAVWYREDRSFGVLRMEVRCARCDGHLGHVFDDGPRAQTGLRYCMDGDALVFKADVR